MAERPIFVPKMGQGPLIEVYNIPIDWHGGFSLSQKQKNITALHSAAKKLGLSPILEISTKSPCELGRRLSAFNLKISADGQIRTLESVYQSTKIFSVSGQHSELIDADPFSVKKLIRKVSAGDIVGFRFEGRVYPTEPKNAFYDWLYIRAIAPHADWLRPRLHYMAYSDIEFTPGKSINCQGRAVAEFHSLMARGIELDCALNFDRFQNVLKYSQRHEA